MFDFSADYDPVTPTAGELIAELRLDAPPRPRRLGRRPRPSLHGPRGADVTVNQLTLGGGAAWPISALRPTTVR